jgi:hypothetical protein
MTAIRLDQTSRLLVPEGICALGRAAKGNFFDRSRAALRAALPTGCFFSEEI